MTELQNFVKTPQASEHLRKDQFAFKSTIQNQVHMQKLKLLKVKNTINDNYTEASRSSSIADSTFYIQSTRNKKNPLMFSADNSSDKFNRTMRNTSNRKYERINESQISKDIHTCAIPDRLLNQNLQKYTKLFKKLENCKPEQAASISKSLSKLQKLRHRGNTSKEA